VSEREIDRALRKSLGITVKEWRVVRDAAKDAHMHVRTYCRLMVMAAAGMGGVIEHLERAFDASWKAQKP
jgi:hypothetical protein